MIFYFSAEGNSAWVAKKIAQATNDQAVSIIDIRRRLVAQPVLEAEEAIGLVFPVYAWAPPTILIDFVKTLSVNPGTYVYAICTCGDTAGHTIKLLNKHISIGAGFSIQMPNTYVLLADVDRPALVKEKIAAARLKIEHISAAISARETVFDIETGHLAGFKSQIIAPLFQMSARDKSFYTEDSCTACSICVKVCPLQNIALENEKPKWLGHCLHCLACYHHCPEHAIQYGKTTKKCGQYVFPKSEKN